MSLLDFKNTTEEDIHEFIYIFMNEVFDCFFAEDEKSDFQVAELIFKIVKAIRENNDEFYEEVIKNCDEARKRLGDHFETRGDEDSDDDEEEWAEDDDKMKEETTYVKVDLEQFKNPNSVVYDVKGVLKCSIDGKL